MTLRRRLPDQHLLAELENGKGPRDEQQDDDEGEDQETASAHWWRALLVEAGAGNLRRPAPTGKARGIDASVCEHCDETLAGKPFAIERHGVTLTKVRIQFSTTDKAGTGCLTKLMVWRGSSCHPD